MIMAKTKTTGFFFKMSPQEWEWVEERMAETNINNKSAFIRKMCIDGHIINLDLDAINEIGKLLRITANNVNQIARRVNSGGGVHREEVEHITNQLTEIRTDFGKLLSELSELTNPKPGKRFLPPLTLRDLPEHSDSEVVS